MRQESTSGIFRSHKPRELPPRRQPVAPRGRPLKAAGHSASHIGDHGLLTATDDAIFDWAAENNAVVVTADSDFAMLLATRRTSTPPVVLLRDAADQPPAVHAKLLVANLNAVEPDGHWRDRVTQSPSAPNPVPLNRIEASSATSRGGGVRAPGGLPRLQRQRKGFVGVRERPVARSGGRSGSTVAVGVRCRWLPDWPSGQPSRSVHGVVVVAWLRLRPTIGGDRQRIPAMG